MPRYYCDYCDNYLTHDSPSVRKQHNAGFKHKANVRAYFLQFEQQETEDMLEKKMADNMAKLRQPGFGRPGGPAMPIAGLMRPPGGGGGPPMGGPPMGGGPMGMPPPGMGRPPMRPPPGMGMAPPPGARPAGPGPGMPPSGGYGPPAGGLPGPPHMGGPPGGALPGPPGSGPPGGYSSR